MSLDTLLELLYYVQRAAPTKRRLDSWGNFRGQIRRGPGYGGQLHRSEAFHNRPPNVFEYLHFEASAFLR